MLINKKIMWLVFFLSTQGSTLFAELRELPTKLLSTP